MFDFHVKTCWLLAGRPALLFAVYLLDLNHFACVLCGQRPVVPSLSVYGTRRFLTPIYGVLSSLFVVYGEPGPASACPSVC